MDFGDRIIYKDENREHKGVFIEQLNSVEALVKLDEKRDKIVVPKKDIRFVKNMDDMDLIHAIAVADYIAKEKYDGHTTLLCFTTGCKFCFGTLDKINYSTTSLMASGKTIEEAIKNSIIKNIDADKVLEYDERMFK